MRSIQEYLSLVEQKYETDHPVTGISLDECISFVVNSAVIDDEICEENADLLTERIERNLQKKVDIEKSKTIIKL